MREPFCKKVLSNSLQKLLMLPKRPHPSPILIGLLCPFSWGGVFLAKTLKVFGKGFGGNLS
ncbi:MAG: hypothetical protein AAB356_08845, partial [Deltaproteobacteria bacterium]